MKHILFFILAWLYVAAEEKKLCDSGKHDINLNGKSLEDQIKILREEIFEMKYEIYELSGMMIIHNREFREIHEKLDQYQKDIHQRVSDLEDRNFEKNIQEYTLDPFDKDQVEISSHEVNILNLKSIKYVEKMNLLSFFGTFYQNDTQYHGSLSYLWPSYYVFLRIQNEDLHRLF
jgi:hypothetical protein